MTNLGAHTIDQVLYVMNVKGPTLVTSTGGRYALEDDGETPDIQDAMWVFPGPTPESKGFMMNAAIREANAGRSLSDTASRGQLYLGTKGSMVLAGNWEVFPENKIDPVNDIPRFMGHPIGGPVYTDMKPTPWIEPSKGQVVESDARYGTGGEDTMAMNERDWLNCIRAASGRSAKWKTDTACRSPATWRTCRCGSAARSAGIRRRKQVIGDKEAAAMCVRPYRAPWDKALREYRDASESHGSRPRIPVSDVRARSCCAPAQRASHPATRPSRLPGRRPAQSPPSSVAHTQARAGPGPCCASDRG